MASEKRCLYEVLGLQRDCSPDEIRSTYKKLALQRHPDKLIQSGISETEATAGFQELVNAYEVLSDPKERAWYDSHRSQILFSDPNSVSNSVIPDLYSYFSNTVYSGYSNTGKGFYKVYSEVFNGIYANEVNFAKKMGLGLEGVREAPLMGGLDNDYAQVSAFYNYWLGFNTVLDFCWVDQYDVMAGPNRKSRRVMEDENKKLRKKARREFNETVRGLAEFVKKRDKRVVDMMVKKNLEMERRREEEKERRKKLERERMAKASAYEEPEWAKIDEEEIENVEEIEGENKRNELYCVVCGKKFKSEKQWKNHEQSKKHKEKVAELRESFADEDDYQEEAEAGEESEKFEEEEGVEERLNGNVDSEKEGVHPFQLVEDEVDELEEQFRDGVGIEEEGIEEEIESSDEHDTVIKTVNHNVKNAEGVGKFSGSDGDEMSVLEAMLSGRKNRRKVAARFEANVSTANTHNENGSKEEDYMEYGNRKITRRNKGAKKSRGKKNENGSQAEENNVHDDSHMEQSSSHSFAENNSTDKGEDRLTNDHKISRHTVERKETSKKDTGTKSKNSSKGKKSKATSKNSGNVCETCGEDFESRNRLHKHLGDTGHASLKSR